MKDTGKFKTVKFEDEVDTNIPFSIQKIDDSFDRSLMNFDEPHRHNFHIITFLKGGHGESTHSVDFVDYQSKPFSVFIIRAFQVHLFRKLRATGLEVYVITFPKDFILQNDFPILDDVENVNEIILTETDFNYIYDILDKIYQEFISEHGWRANIIQSYLNIILTHLSRIYLGKKDSTQENEKEDSLVIKYKKLLNEKYLEYRHVSDFSKELFLSPGHLNDKIKEITGKTAKELLNERIILEAKRLLFYDNRSIKEIADSLNYNDTAYFARFFKKQTKLTPQEFRQKFRKIS